MWRGPTGAMSAVASVGETKSTSDGVRHLVHCPEISKQTDNTAESVASRVLAVIQ